MTTGIMITENNFLELYQPSNCNTVKKSEKQKQKEREVKCIKRGS